jgi:hypothetical protein
MAGSGCLCAGSFGASEVLKNYNSEKSKLKLIESEGSRIRVKWFGQAPTEGQIKKSQIL